MKKTFLKYFIPIVFTIEVVILVITKCSNPAMFPVIGTFIGIGSTWLFGRWMTRIFPNSYWFFLTLIGVTVGVVVSFIIITLTKSENPGVDGIIFFSMFFSMTTSYFVVPVKDFFEYKYREFNQINEGLKSLLYEEALATNWPFAEEFFNENPEKEWLIIHSFFANIADSGKGGLTKEEQEKISRYVAKGPILFFPRDYKT